MNFDSIRNLAFIILIVLFVSSIITLFISPVIEGYESSGVVTTTTPNTTQGYTNPGLANFTFTPISPITYIESKGNPPPIVKLQNFFTNLNNSVSKYGEGVGPLQMLYMKLGDSIKYLANMKYIDAIPSNISNTLSDDAKQQINTAITNKINAQIQLINENFGAFMIGADKVSNSLNAYRLLDDYRNDISKMKIACNGFFG
jgi:hypothetical protein